MNEGSTRTEPQLTALSELPEHRVAEGNPDIRGWVVEGADGGRLGEVRELLVDTRAMKARYMVIGLVAGLPGIGHGHDALVPLSRARLDDAGSRVYLDDVTVATAYTLTRYVRNLTPERSVANPEVRPADDPALPAGEAPAQDAREPIVRESGDQPYVVVVERTTTETRVVVPARVKEEV